MGNAGLQGPAQLGSTAELDWLPSIVTPASGGCLGTLVQSSLLPDQVFGHRYLWLESRQNIQTLNLLTLEQCMIPGRGSKVRVQVRKCMGSKMPLKSLKCLKDHIHGCYTPNCQLQFTGLIVPKLCIFRHQNPIYGRRCSCYESLEASDHPEKLQIPTFPFTLTHLGAYAFSPHPSTV